jgi:hypothetical protein
MTMEATVETKIAEPEKKDKSKEFLLTDEKSRLLDIFNAMGIMSNGKNALISPVAMNVMGKSMEFGFMDKTGTIVVFGKWTPKVLQPGEVTDLVVNPEIVCQAIMSMNDAPVSLRLEENLLVVSTNQCRARIRVELKPSGEALKIPQFKKFEATWEGEANEIRSVMERASKMLTPKRYRLHIDGNILNLDLGSIVSDNLDYTSKVVGMVKLLGQNADDIASDFPASVVSSLFKIPPGKMTLSLGKDYPLKMEMSDPTLNISYILSPETQQ